MAPVAESAYFKPKASRPSGQGDHGQHAQSNGDGSAGSIGAFPFDQGQIKSKGRHSTQDAHKLGIHGHVGKSRGAITVTLQEREGDQSRALCHSRRQEESKYVAQAAGQLHLLFRKSGHELPKAKLREQKRAGAQIISPAESTGC